MLNVFEEKKELGWIGGGGGGWVYSGGKGVTKMGKQKKGCRERSRFIWSRRPWKCKGAKDGHKSRLGEKGNAREREARMRVWKQRDEDEQVFLALALALITKSARTYTHFTHTTFFFRLSFFFFKFMSYCTRTRIPVYQQQPTLKSQLVLYILYVYI